MHQHNCQASALWNYGPLSTVTLFAYGAVALCSAALQRNVSAFLHAEAPIGRFHNHILKKNAPVMQVHGHKGNNPFAKK